MVDDPRLRHYQAIIGAIDGIEECLQVVATAQALADGNTGLVIAAVGDDPPNGTPNRVAHEAAHFMRRHIQQAAADGRQAIAALQALKARV
jgi:hypothetical protein